MPKPYQEKRLRPLIFSGATVITIIIIIGILGANGFFHKNPYGNGIKIENFSRVYPQISSDTQDFIYSMLYNAAVLNPIMEEDVDLAKSIATFQKDYSPQNNYNQETEVYSSIIRVDVPAVRQTFTIHFLWSIKDNNPNLSESGDQVVIQCALNDASTYHATSCSDGSPDNAISKAYTEYPLISHLPIKKNYYLNDGHYVSYDIIYDSNNIQEGVLTIIIIDYSYNNQERALKDIRDLGYDPKDYNIQYYTAYEYSQQGKNKEVEAP